MANRRQSVATTFIAFMGLGAVAVAIVAIALSFTAAAAQRIDDADQQAATVNLLEHRQSVSAILAAEEAANIIDLINGPGSMATAPITAQRTTAVETASEGAKAVTDRADSVGNEAQRWLAGLDSAVEPSAIEDPFDRMVAYNEMVQVACCSGVVPSDGHHVAELRDLETTALLSSRSWDYMLIAIEAESRRGPGIPGQVSRFIETLGTTEVPEPDAPLPSEELAEDLARFVPMGVTQEAINALLASEAIDALDNLILHSTDRGSVVVSVEESYAAADAVARSIDELFAEAVESTRARLTSSQETAEQIRLVTRIVSPLLLLVLAGFGFVVHRFARNREAAQRREQDLLDARNRFMRMVSHELRTPATAISGFAEMLGTDWTSLTEPEIAEFLAIINRQSTHLSMMVDDLLTLSHLETGRLRLHLGIVNLKQAADDAIALVDARYGIAVETTIDPVVTLVADPDRLVQIIRNLVENAAKYGKTGVAVTAAVVGSGCEIVVSDTGPGIPQEMTNRIFRFWDRGEKDGSRVRGYGMGLAIARHLAQAMVGDLIYRPHEPVGNEFVLSLPLGPADIVRLAETDTTISVATAG